MRVVAAVLEVEDSRAAVMRRKALAAQTMRQLQPAKAAVAAAEVAADAAAVAGCACASRRPQDRTKSA
jgi:hypothetical protein